MISTTSPPRWLTPPQVAEQLAVDPAKVLTWIRSGALAAVNVGEGPLRPRFRVSPEALSDFLRRRQTTPPTPRPRRRRRWWQ